MVGPKRRYRILLPQSPLPVKLTENGETAVLKPPGFTSDLEIAPDLAAAYRSMSGHLVEKRRLLRFGKRLTTANNLGVGAI